MSVMCYTLLCVTIPVPTRRTLLGRRGTMFCLIAGDTGDTPPVVTVPVSGRGAPIRGRGTLTLLTIVRHTYLRDTVPVAHTCNIMGHTIF